MAQRLKSRHYDVVVVGGGCAGVAAAVAAAKNGANTLLIEAGPMLGGELLSGIAIDGCLSTRGDWVVGGVVKELIDDCDRMGGYWGAIYDYRTIWVACIDPEIMKMSVINVVQRNNVNMLLYSFVEDVIVDDGKVSGVIVLNKSQRTLITADCFIDCSGDADVAVLAGAPYESGSPTGEYQPVSMSFRMMGVETEPLMQFAKQHPENFALAENPYYDYTPEECIERLIKQGLPKVFFTAKGPLLSQAIERGEMYPTALIAVIPTSWQRKEVCLNTTRVANVDATDTQKLSNSLPELFDQVWSCVTFMQKRVPGFENAVFSGAAPRIGVRETRRIVGEETLTIDDVLDARKRDDGVARGAHHVDIHGGGNHQLRRPIRNGGSYDIPYGSLVPKELKNVLVAGRCLSASREAHGSARVMGTCMAMGQAVGTAASMLVSAGSGRKDTNEIDVRDIDIVALRNRLTEQGAVVDGVE